MYQRQLRQSRGGDDMGNHTKTQDLDMDGNDIFDVQHISGSGNISGSLGNILGYKSGSFQQLGKNVVSHHQFKNKPNRFSWNTNTRNNRPRLISELVANEHVDHSITLTAVMDYQVVER